MAVTKALVLLATFLTIQQITAKITTIPTPTFKPIIVTMHGGPTLTATQQRELVSYDLPIFTICPLQIAVNRSGSCFTSFYPTTTRICSTTLSPLAAPLIPITACNQNVTFSTDHGFKVASTLAGQTLHALRLQGQETPTGSVENLTTYYAAPWTDLSAGAVPTGPVQAVTCSAGGCTTRMEMWRTEAREVIMTSTQTMQFQVQVTGPADIVVGANATTIPVPATNGTQIAYSSALRTTQTSTSTRIVKSAMSEAPPAAPAAASGTPPTIPTLTLAPPSAPVVSLIRTAAGQGASGGVEENDVTTTVNETVTIRSTSTTTITVLAPSVGTSVGRNGTGMYA